MKFVSLGKVDNAFQTLQQAIANRRLKVSDLSAVVLLECCLGSDPKRVAEIQAAFDEDHDAIDTPSGFMDFFLGSLLPGLYRPEWNTSNITSCAFRVKNVGDYVVEFDANGARQSTLSPDAATVQVVSDPATLFQVVRDFVRRGELTQDELDARGCGTLAALDAESAALAGGASDGSCWFDTFWSCPFDICWSQGLGCSVDFGGGDACNTEYCGADACYGDACGYNACGMDTCGMDGCGADACGGDMCGGNMCAGNACAADACPADVCPVNVN